VVDALRRLPVEQQTLLELYYWQELEIGAIGEVFEVEIGTARVRLHRARRKLRDLLEAEGDLQAIEMLGKSEPG
jgi:RNA polymerase sigma-70 factor (ECF subfamily)